MICVTIFMTEDHKIVHSKTLTFSGHHTHTDRKCNPYVSQPLRGETTKFHYLMLNCLPVATYVILCGSISNIKQKL